MIRRILTTLVLLLACTSLHAQGLPPVKLQFASIITAADGSVLEYVGAERRVELPSTGSVSKWVIRALLATEDRDFYNHDGVSMKGLGRAVLKTLTGDTQGGSTLTMQLARNLFLSHERSVSRKLREIELAQEIEKRYSKDEILLLYLNTVYFGSGNYGVWTAAREYFSKAPADLSITESAMLVGLLQSPEGYNPLRHPEKALRRRNQVLRNLLDVGRLSKKEFERERRLPLGLNPRPRIGRHAAEYARREAERILARLGRSLGEGPFRIATTIDAALQAAADRAVEAQWKELPSGMKDVQIGLACVEAGSGALRALVGGNPESGARDLNHATQIRRQAGSSFKPFLYASLLEQGYPLSTPILDAPLVVDSGTAWEWRPSNDNDSSAHAAVPMKFAIQRSLNLVAAHAITELTSPEEMAAFAQRCGIVSELRPFPSLALGSSEVSPLEMAAAFGVFASQGKRAAPFVITRIEDAQRRVLHVGRPDTATVLDSATAFLLTDALAAAVDSGTGRTVRRYYAGPAAGKTGTTQQSTDAWFVGYTPRLSMAVWAGFDNPSRKLGGGFRYGGTMCAPIWGRVMADAARRATPADSAFALPSDVAMMPLCRESGMLAGEHCPVQDMYPVNVMRLPGECDKHNDIMPQE
ncbi:MAG TPA: transglycosylase domain-containing protein [Bacteroidota bacterium]|nr:transglycosylase domain-containing protein [Bacteroidota bacterium]